MKAVILAGGEGKRLRPITCTQPKPMVKLLNKPTVFYTLDLLKKHGIRDVTITLGYMGNDIRNAIGSGDAWGLNVSYSDPEERLGTAGSVREAAGGCDETILVMSGDGITDVDLTSAANAHKASGAAVTVVLYRVAEPTEYGVALSDKDGFISRFIEKPTAGEVFSDKANTGIYFIEPRALELVPAGSEYDFSKELFPDLMKKGEKLFGYEMSGYWCDIGNASELRRAQEDMLDGRCVFQTSARYIDGAFVEPGAMISPSAKLMRPCYIAVNSEVAAGAEIGPYTVICEGAKIMEKSRVERTAVFDGAVIRRNCDLRGAIVCENAQIDSHSILSEGAVIGAGAAIGKRTTVSQGVLIWPEKSIEPNTRCNRNVIWGENKRLEYSGSSFSGYADRELTPEAALKIASAFASVSDRRDGIAVGSDGSAASVMIKQAAVSGILSQGTDAVSINAVSASAFGHLIRSLGLSGGLFVETSQFDRRVRIGVYGKRGVEAASSVLRSISNELNTGSGKPTTSSEIGIVRSVTSADAEYEANLAGSVDSFALRNEPKKLIINAPQLIADCAARILLKAGWTVDTVSECRKLIPTHNSDAISILCEKSERISVHIAPGVIADNETVLAAIALDSGFESVLLPDDISEQLTGIVSDAGINCISAPSDPALRRIAADKAGLYHNVLHEPEAIIVKLCEMFSRGKLVELLRSLPKTSRTESTVPVARREFGRLLRSVIETEYDRVASMAEGVKLRFESGWVTVRPDEKNASFRIIAGGRDAEYAKELCDICTDKLRALKRNDERLE